jgi:hypothetical protein
MITQKMINIPETTLEKWDDKYLPSYDLIYLEDDLIGLPEDILVMPLNELKANPSLYTIDVTTTFSPWNLEDSVKFVAVIPNDRFDSLGKDLEQRMLELQHDLCRDNLHEIKELNRFIDELDESERNRCIVTLEQMTFYVKGEAWVAFRRNHWQKLPWEFRKKILVEMAESYNGEGIQQRMDANAYAERAFIQSYVDQFPSESGPNCFATALAAITENRISADWIIQQWIHSETFIMGIQQRGYEKINENTDWKQIDLKADDIIVWVNKERLPIHASAALSEVDVFNKDGQTMFNPWLIRNFHELAGYWDETIQEGGLIYHYRKMTIKNDSE